MGGIAVWDEIEIFYFFKLFGDDFGSNVVHTVGISNHCALFFKLGGLAHHQGGDSNKQQRIQNKGQDYGGKNRPFIAEHFQHFFTVNCQGALKIHCS